MQFVDIQYRSPPQLSHFELGSKIFDLSYFFQFKLFFSKKKMVTIFPVLLPIWSLFNSNDYSSKLSFEEYYVSVAK